MTAWSISTLDDDLASRLTRGASAFFGIDAEPAIGGVQRRAHPYSTILRIELKWPAQSRWIYLKTLPRTRAHDSIAAERLATEFRVLGDLWKHFAGRHDIGVVQPYGLYADRLAIATVDAQGINLRYILGRRARRWTLPGRRIPLVRLMERCGMWLRDFQAFTRRESGTFDVAELQSYCGVRLALLADLHPARFDSRFNASIVARMAEIGASAAATNTAISGRHNDYTAHNIIAVGDGVRVLDFSMFDYGSVALDPCNFWLDLETLKADPSYSPSLLGELQDRFVGTYGMLSTCDPLFSVMRCRYTLTRLLTVLDSPPHWTSRARIDRRRMAAGCYQWLQRFARGLTS